MQKHLIKAVKYFKPFNYGIRYQLSLMGIAVIILTGCPPYGDGDQQTLADSSGDWLIDSCRDENGNIFTVSVPKDPNKVWPDFFRSYDISVELNQKIIEQLGSVSFSYRDSIIKMIAAESAANENFRMRLKAATILLRTEPCNPNYRRQFSDLVNKIEDKTSNIKEANQIKENSDEFTKSYNPQAASDILVNFHRVIKPDLNVPRMVGNLKLTGDWNDLKGYKYSFVITLFSYLNDSVGGNINWKLLEAPQGSRLNQMIFETGTEEVSGMYDKSMKKITLTGLSVDRPDLIDTDKYSLTLNNNGTFNGKSLSNERDWSGHLSGIYTNDEFKVE